MFDNFIILNPLKLQFLNRNKINCVLTLEKIEHENKEKLQIYQELENNFIGIQYNDLTEVDVLGVLIDSSINLF